MDDTGTYGYVNRQVAATIGPVTGKLYAMARKLDVSSLNADNGIEVQLQVSARSAAETIWMTQCSRP